MAIGNQQFAGLITLDDTLVGSLLVTNASTGAPVNADALPTFRVYGPNQAVVTSGSCTLRDSGSITLATNATPIVITSTAHGLTNGARVTVSGVGGNTAANGTWTVANVATDTFELASSAGNGAYTSGGTWNVTGFYKYSIAVSGGSGFESGEPFQVNFSYDVSSVNQGQTHSFNVS